MLPYSVCCYSFSENEPGEKSPVPLPVEQSETAVFRIPGIGRARLALNYDFHGFMEYVNTAVDGTFRFQDVTSIEGYSFSGITAMESKNLFRNILHSNLPNGGQVTVVLQRNSIRIDDHRPPSIALIDTSSAHSETERPTPIASVMIDTSTSPLETRHETSMSCDSNDTCSTPAEILGESSMGASATERVNVKAGPAIVVNVGLPQCKAPKTPAGNDSGKVVYWKGHDAKVTVAYMLQNASTFGRITNMSLHNVSQDATTSFIEFETEESANRFANSCPQRFKKSKYSAIRTRDKAVLVIFSFAFIVTYKLPRLVKMLIPVDFYRKKFRISIVSSTVAGVMLESASGGGKNATFSGMCRSTSMPECCHCHCLYMWIFLGGFLFAGSSQRCIATLQKGKIHQDFSFCPSLYFLSYFICFHFFSK